MEFPDYNNPQDLARFLEARDMAPQKRFGQNFMINPGARRQIVDLLAQGSALHVWEIGPGLGALTREILERGHRVTAFEIDKGYQGILRELFAGFPGFSLVEGDALKTWEAHRHPGPDAILGNLPYNVGTAMVTRFLEEGLRLPMVFTLQREVADRMRAQPSSDNYGSFSVFCQLFGIVKVPLVLKPGSFWPAPEVTSAVVHLLPRTDVPAHGSMAVLNQVLRAFFSSRRKTIRNNLKQSPFAVRPGFDASAAVLEACGVSLDARAETLDPATFARISAGLYEALESETP